MFGNLVVWYLFLGGLSGGSTLAALAVRWLARTRGSSWHVFERAFCRPLLYVSLASLAAGCVCLLGDLRRPEAAHLLFVSPTLNVMNIGALLLAFLGVLLLALIAFYVRPTSVRHGGRCASCLFCALEALSAVTAFAVVVYTGLYLRTFWTVALWASPLLVLLFVLSAASCGVAAVYACAAFARPNVGAYRRGLAAFERADLAVVALEAVALAAMLAQLYFAARASGLPGPVETLDSAGLAMPFWAGFIGCGLVVPALAALVGNRVRLDEGVRCAVLAVALLVGGFFLRYCMINVPVAYKAFMLAGM